jgi:exosortase
MPEPLNNPESCKAVILVGSCDFGRCPLASRLNRALWPVFGKPALQLLLDQLAEQGIRRAVISCENQSATIQNAIHCPPQLSITFQEKTLPRGPAGCIRDAAEAGDECLLVLPGNVLALPPIRDLLVKHRRSQADMTIFLNPVERDQKEDSQIYLCEPTILSCIPETGFVDLKEGFVPASIQKGLTIRADALPKNTGHYRTWYDYVMKLKSRLIEPSRDKMLRDFSLRSDFRDVWVGSNVHISENAKIFGPVVIDDRASIADKVMIFGPAIIGKDTAIGPDALIEESVLWDHVAIGAGARVYGSLVDSMCTIRDGQHVSEKLVPTPVGSLQKAVHQFRRKQICRRIEQGAWRYQSGNRLTLNQILETKSQKIAGLILTFLLLAVLVASYWKPTLKSLLNVWLESDEYSSGLLVPVIAGYVLWLRRKSLGRIVIKPSIWALGLLLAAQSVRFFGLYYMFSSVERLSLVLTIGAVVLLLFGWDFFKKFSPIFLFLFLMLPLPNRVESVLTIPLQAWATVSSVFCLEMLGFSVVRQGNIIDINGTLVAVAEACNGLRMLTAFIVVSGLVALTVNRRWPTKLVVLLSSIPIALACNTLRLTITAIAFTKLDTERWEKIFHDFGGFAMMPVALLIIVLELWLLSSLIIEPNNKQQQVVYRNETISSERKKG